MSRSAFLDEELMGTMPLISWLEAGRAHPEGAMPGDVYYNTEEDMMFMYDGIGWVGFASAVHTPDNRRNDMCDCWPIQMAEEPTYKEALDSLERVWFNEPEVLAAVQADIEAAEAWNEHVNAIDRLKAKRVLSSRA